MKEKLQLYTPEVRGYCMHAYPLSIIKKDESYYSWLYSNFIQLYCHKDFNDCRVPYNFFIPIQFSKQGNDAEYKYVIDVCSYFFSIPFLDVQKISRNSINEKNIVDIIKELINLNNYIIMYVDEYGIPEKKAYRNYHKHHEILIYGYDDELSVFNTIGYKANDQYGVTDVGYSDFILSYNIERFKLPFFRNYIYAIKYVERNCFFDIKTVINELNKYRYSFESSNLSFSMYTNDDFVYGFDTYGKLSENIIHNARLNKKVDLRPVYILFEHKNLMLKRLEFIYDKGYISENSFKYMFEIYKNIVSLLKNTTNMIIKYNIVKNENIISKVLINLEKVYKMDFDSVNQLIILLS